VCQQSKVKLLVIAVYREDCRSLCWRDVLMLRMILKVQRRYYKIKTHKQLLKVSTSML